MTKDRSWDTPSSAKLVGDPSMAAVDSSSEVTRSRSRVHPGSTPVDPHPKLPMHEHAPRISRARLTEAEFEVTTAVEGTGVVGVLRKGDGPTVELRVPVDALPVREASGLPYWLMTPPGEALGGGA